MKTEDILNDFLPHTKTWVEHFNKGDLDYCVNAYTKDAIMTVGNVGEFKGHEEIKGFWVELTKTANYLEYNNTNINVIDSKTVHLNSDWKMNIGEGIITLEEWVKQDDGSWKLTKDAFEVLKQY